MESCGDLFSRELYGHGIMPIRAFCHELILRKPGILPTELHDTEAWEKVVEKEPAQPPAIIAADAEGIPLVMPSITGAFDIDDLCLERRDKRRINCHNKTLLWSVSIFDFPVLYQDYSRSPKISKGCWINIVAPLSRSSSSGRNPQRAPTGVMPAAIAVLMSTAVSPR
jgi:hypothetical protein